MSSEIISELIAKTTELNAELSEKNWSAAISIDKARLELLSCLSQSTDINDVPVNYIDLLERLLKDVRTAQSAAEDELLRCKSQMGEFGQQRRASSLYQDTALAG